MDESETESKKVFTEKPEENSENERSDKPARITEQETESEPKKKLKIYGILFLVLGAWDIVSIVISYFTGELSVSKFSSENAPIARKALIIIIAITCFFAFIKIYAGISGLRRAKGRVKAKGLVPLMKILLVVEILSFLAFFISVFQGKADYSQLFSTLASVIIIFDYLKNLKVIRSVS